MKGNEVFFQLLSYLTNEEFSQFSAWVAVRITDGQSKHTAVVLEYLSGIHPKYSEGSASLAGLAKALLLKKRIQVSKSTISRCLNAMFPLLEEFISQLELRNHPQTHNYLLRQFASKRGNLELYEQYWQYAETSTALQKDDAERQFSHWQLRHEKLFHPTLGAYNRSLPSLSETIHHLESSFSIMRSLYYLNEINEAMMFEHSAAEEDGLAKAALRMLDLLNTQQHPLGLSIYTVKELLLKQDDINTYLQAKRTIFQSLPKLSQADGNILLRQLLNVVNRRVKVGDSFYLNESLLIYKEGLTSGVLLYQGLLPIHLYINIQAVADVAREFEWTAWFLKEYESAIIGPMAAEIIKLAWCGHRFNRGAAEKSTDLLQDSITSLPNGHLPVWYNLRRYSIEVRAIYELFNLDDQNTNEYDRLMAAIHRLERYIDRDEQINKQNLQYYKDGLLILKKLAKLKLDWHIRPSASKINAKEKLLDTLKAYDVNWKFWLTKKVEELV